MSDYIWKNISWKTKYNQYWSFSGWGSMEETGCQNLRKCFQELFGLDVSFNGSYFEAYISNGIPVIFAKGEAGSRISISGLHPYQVLKMRKAGSVNTDMQERTADENGVVLLTGGAGSSEGGEDVFYYFGEIGIGQSITGTYLFNSKISEVPLSTSTNSAVFPITSVSVLENNITKYQDDLYGFRADMKNIKINRLHDWAARLPYDDVSKKYGYEWNGLKDIEKTKYFNGVNGCYCLDNFNNDISLSDVSISDKTLIVQGNRFPFNRMYLVVLNYSNNWEMNVQNYTTTYEKHEWSEGNKSSYVELVEFLHNPNVEFSFSYSWYEFVSSNYSFTNDIFVPTSSWSLLTKKPDIFKFDTTTQTITYEIASDTSKIKKDLENNNFNYDSYLIASLQGLRYMTCGSKLTVTLKDIPADIKSTTYNNWFSFSSKRASDAIAQSMYVDDIFPDQCGWGCYPSYIGGNCSLKPYDTSNLIFQIKAPMIPYQSNNPANWNQTAHENVFSWITNSYEYTNAIRMEEITYSAYLFVAYQIKYEQNNKTLFRLYWWD